MIFSCHFACLVIFCRMPDTVNFALIECCILTSADVVENCLGMQLSYLETVWSFWFLLLKCLRKDQSHSHFMADYHPLLRPDSSDYAPRAPWITSFPVWLVGRGTVPALGEYWVCLISLWFFHAASNSFLTQICWSVLCLIVLCAALSSLGLCLADSNQLCLLGSPGFFLPVLPPGHCVEAENWAAVGLNSVVSHFSRMFVFHCPKSMSCKL